MRVDKVGIAQTFHIDKRLDLVVRPDIEKVLDCTSLAGLCAFRDVVNLHPIATSLLREEQHIVMHRSRIYILDEVLFACRSAFGADTATILRAELCQRSALDVSKMRDCDNHVVVGIEILSVELFRRVNNFRATLVTVFVTSLDQFILNYLAANIRIVQD